MKLSQWNIKTWVKWKLGITDIQHIKVFVTNKCNAKCPTCKIWKMKPHELSYRQAMIIAKHFKGIKSIIISGGEPTLWPHLIPFINALEVDQITLNTNGIDHEELQHVIIETNKRMKIAISLNGTSLMHNRSKGVICYNDVIKSIKLVNDFGLRCTVAFGLFKNNFNEYEYIEKFVKDNNLGATVCFPVDTGERLKSEWKAPDKKDLIKFYTERMKKDSRFGQWIWQYWMDGVFNNKPMKCIASYDRICIMPIGWINVCSEWPDSHIGYVSDTEVGWNKNRLKYHRKQMNNYKCMYDGKHFCGSAFLQNSPWNNIPGVVIWKIKKFLKLV